MKLSETASLTVFYETIDLPPPFSYRFEMSIYPDQGKVDFQLEYTDREDLDEDEIVAEGFSMNDDFKWSGALPGVWKKTLVNFLAQSNLKKSDGDEAAFRVALKDGESVENFIPADPERWERIFQELLQAMYEWEEKTYPLTIGFLKVFPGGADAAAITVSFGERTAYAIVRTNNREKKKDLTWETAQQMMKKIYTPDYIYEKALQKKPSSPGLYIDHGEGYWFKVGEGVVKPHKSSGILGELEKLMEELLQ